MEAWPGRGEGGVRAWLGIIGVAVATPATPVAPALLNPYVLSITNLLSMT